MRPHDSINQLMNRFNKKDGIKVIYCDLFYLIKERWSSAWPRDGDSRSAMREYRRLYTGKENETLWAFRGDARNVLRGVSDCDTKCIFALWSAEKRAKF